MYENNLELATFAAGCFWGVEEAFLKMKGVKSTRVGYTGGNFLNPSYEDVCNDRTSHAEDWLYFINILLSFYYKISTVIQATKCSDF